MTTTTAPTLLNLPARPGEYILDGVTVVINGLHKVTWRSDCDTCIAQGRGPITPAHDAPTDGHGPHCTCRGCF